MSSYRIYHSMFALGPRRLRWTTVRVGSFHGQALYHASSSTLSVPQRLIFNKTPQILKVPFHTSSPRPAPQFLLFFAPVSRFLVAIGARLTRSWWSRLTPERREAIKASLRKNRRYFYSVLGVITLFGAGFYVTHIEEAPLTHRRRFIMFPRKKVLSIIEKEKESIAEMFKQHFLSHNHPAYKRVHEIVSRILTANDTPEFQGFNWGLYVIDNPDVVNALCLPTGDIFVYTGLINQCKNDEELAFILSHEIAHAVLDHGMENLSRSGIINFLQLFLIAIIWAVVPNDLVSYFMHRTSGTTVQVLLEYPYSRKLETEADKVGLMIAAKACYNPEQAVSVWKHFQNDYGKDLEFLATHPSNETRLETLQVLLPEAYGVWKRSECAEMKEEVSSFQEAIKKQLKRIFVQ